MDVIDKGLNQIPAHGLRRLIAHIDAGKPLLLNGAITNGLGHG